MDTEIYSEFVKRLMKPGKEIQKEMTPKKLELEHMANLLGSESGEILTYVKRHVFYGQELDMPAIKKELGDVMFAFTAICNILGLEVHDIRELNQQKLTARYPLGLYSNEQAKARADENEDPDSVDSIDWRNSIPNDVYLDTRTQTKMIFKKVIRLYPIHVEFLVKDKGFIILQCQELKTLVKDSTEDPNAINWNTIAPGSMITNGRVVLRFSKMNSAEEFEAVSNDEVVVTGSVHGNWKFKYINSSVS